MNSNHRMHILKDIFLLRLIDEFASIRLETVNMWRGIKMEGAGIVNNDTLDGTEKKLQAWQMMSENDCKKMAEQAEASFKKRLTSDAMGKSRIATIEKFKKVKA